MPSRLPFKFPDAREAHAKIAIKTNEQLFLVERAHACTCLEDRNLLEVRFLFAVRLLTGEPLSQCAAEREYFRVDAKTRCTKGGAR